MKNQAGQMKKINNRFVKMNKRKKLKDLSNAFRSNEEKRCSKRQKKNPGGLVTGCRGKRQQISGMIRRSGRSG
jgi:hypothetical protein